MKMPADWRLGRPNTHAQPASRVASIADRSRLENTPRPRWSGCVMTSPVSPTIAAWSSRPFGTTIRGEQAYPLSVTSWASRARKLIDGPWGEAP